MFDFIKNEVGDTNIVSIIIIIFVLIMTMLLFYSYIEHLFDYIKICFGVR